MVDPIVERAREHLGAGRWGEAIAALEQGLERSPDDARMLRLLGTAHHLAGHGGEAVRCLEAAIAIEPDALSTWLNAGAVYLAAGRSEDAIGAGERAIAIDPDSVDGHFNLAVALQACSRTADAERSFTRAIEIDPLADDARLHLAGLRLARGAARQAADLAAAVLKRSPGDARAHMCLARALATVGDLDQAARHVDLAERAGHDPRAVALQRIDLLDAAGRHHEALDQLRELARELPESADVTGRLVRSLLATSRHAEADGVLACAAPAFAGTADALMLRASARAGGGDEAGALALARRAGERAPDDAQIHAGIAGWLLEAGELGEADAHYLLAIERAPLLAPAHEGRVLVALARGDATTALTICDAYLARNPRERTLLAARALVLNELGETQAAAALVDLDGLVDTLRPDPPEGFDGIEAFDHALEAHVRAHPSLLESPPAHATRNGRHTGDLLIGDKGPFAQFERMLWDAARIYLDRHGPASHPYLAQRPQLERAVCWAVLMRRAGHQAPHIHPAAWLSGVYYAKVPDAVRNGDAQEGWLEFGSPPDAYTVTRPAATRLVRPEEGLLVLFPSYFYHRTIPYQADAERLSVAFDFLPVVQAGA